MNVVFPVPFSPRSTVICEFVNEPGSTFRVNDPSFFVKAGYL